MPAVTVVIPTLNEAGNIRPLVERLSAAFGTREDWEILFVDDDSSDGTGTEIRRAAQVHPVRVIVREGERGLASAVLRGIDSTDAPVVVVMDADLSHPPEAAPRLADAVTAGADVAIGSRYVPGGGTEGWSKVRLFLSRGAALLTRGLTGARDPGAGFFALHRSLLVGKNLKVEGFKILLEILAKLRPEKVVEIPIHFAPRAAGKSKVAAGTAVAYLKQLFRLYARRPAAHVVALIAVLFAVKVIVGARTELDSVEAYHWLYGQNPALGYYDHPAMVGWMIWLSTALFGDSALGVRMLSFIGSSFAVWFMFLAGRRLYDERAGRFAAILFGVAFGTLKFSSMATPDAPLLLFWTATLWSLAHALSGSRKAWWLGAGVLLGLAMLSKYTAIFLPAGVCLFLLFHSTHRVWLARKEPYLAVLLALAVFSPTILWNAQNDWQSFAYQALGRFEGARRAPILSLRWLIAMQLVLLTPLAALWAWGSGAAALVRVRAAWQDRLLAFVAMPMMLFFVSMTLIRSVRGHWTLVGGATLFLLVGAGVMRSARWVRVMHYAVAGLAGLGVAGGAVAFAFYEPSGLKGWTRLSEEVRKANPAFVMAQDYHVAGHMAYHLRPLPAVDFTAIGEGGKSFRNWWDARKHAGRDAVIVWEKKSYPVGLEGARPYFKSLEDPVEVTVPRPGLESETFVLVRARAYRPEPD